MSYRLKRPLHARCEACGAILHIPWGEGSSVEFAAVSVALRLQEGCAVCHGPLVRVTLDECDECGLWLRDEAS